MRWHKFLVILKVEKHGKIRMMYGIMVDNNFNLTVLVSRSQTAMWDPRASEVKALITVYRLLKYYYKLEK